MKALRSLFVRRPPKRILFLASGRGSNLQAVLEFLQEKPNLGIPVSVFTDNPKAFALEIAQKRQIPTRIFPFASYQDKALFHKELLSAAKELAPDLVVACGYMRILQPSFVQTFPNKILNIHPSLLPAFPGLDAQRQALDYGAKITGCTVHFVEEGVDTGGILLQKAVEISSGMTEKDLSLLILKEEHRLLKRAVQYFCEDRIQIQGRKVILL